MTNNKFEIIYKKPSELIPYIKNPKTHPESQLNKIANSINEYKFDQPIVIDSNNIIIKGHGRWKAALKLDLKLIPVIVRNDLTDKQVKASRIMDNKSAESEWDYPLLKDGLEELDTGDFDMELTGFDENEIEQMMTIYGDEYDPEKEWRGMPEFNQEDLTSSKTIIVHFKTPKDYEDFGNLVKQKITEKTRYIWFPKARIDRYADKEYK